MFQAATYMLVVGVYRVRTGPAETKLNCSVWFQSTVVTTKFKGQRQVHLIYAPKKTTHIITECIEINITISL